MTAIVGIAKGGQVWLGADSCGATSYYRAAFTTPKLVELSTTSSSKLLLGYTTSFRFGQILQYQVGMPHDIRKDAEEYLIRDFIPAARKSLIDHGWMKKESEREQSGAALVGYRGRLFTFQSDLSLTEAQSGLDATGSGYEYALGAMSFAASLGRKAEVILEAGLRAAATFTPGVMEPFTIRKVAA